MNSTNVRFLSTALKFGLATLAPRTAEKAVLRQLMTPQQKSTSRIPSVPGLMTFHRTLITGFHQLAAWEWGKGPAVLLVHDWNGQAADLEGYVVPLVEAGFRVIAADLPAHGRSSGTTASLADLRRAVSAMARYAGTVQGVVAEGLGATAALLAAQDGAPLRRLTLLAPRQTLLHDVRDQALALGYPSQELPTLLQEFETEQHVSLEALDLHRIAGRLTLPTLILEDQHEPEAVVPYAVRFLQQGTLPKSAATQGDGFRITVPHTEYQAAV
ncbi:MAG TPA: alpha/beta fold hydrolase [bacterium]